MEILNLSTQAQHLLAFGHTEANRLNHNFVGTEHLLLGLIRLGQGTAFKILRLLSVDPDAVSREIEKQVGGYINPIICAKEMAIVRDWISRAAFSRVTHNILTCKNLRTSISGLVLVERMRLML